ncbi:MAG: bifunctional metallophosphatase/5'-nucleotidase, partial [Actinopolymorphaceae bacterium]
MSRWGSTGGWGIRAVVAASVAAVGIGVLGTNPAVGAGPEAPAPKPGPAHGGRTAFTLTVLHTNDDESQLLGVDGDTNGNGTIEPDEERAYGGAARYATQWDHLRRDARRGPSDLRGGRHGVL